MFTESSVMNSGVQVKPKPLVSEQAAENSRFEETKNESQTLPPNNQSTKGGSPHIQVQWVRT